MDSESVQTLKEKEKADFGQEQGALTCSSSNEWVWGVGLIALGAVLLFRPFGWLMFANWWALFLVVPAAFGMADGLRHGRPQSIFGPMLLLFIGLIFLFGWSWSIFWPLLLVGLGVKAIVSARQ